MKKTYTARLADLQSVLENSRTKPCDYGFLIRDFLAQEALPVVKQKHKKQLLTQELIDIITPKLKAAHFPSGSTPITYGYSLTLTITKHDNNATKTIKTETVLLSNHD